MNLRILHFCHSSCHDWSCIEYDHEIGMLHLSINKGDAGYTEGCFHEIEVKFCPFCGYNAQDQKLQDKIEKQITQLGEIDAFRDLGKVRGIILRDYEDKFIDDILGK